MQSDGPDSAQQAAAPGILVNRPPGGTRIIYEVWIDDLGEVRFKHKFCMYIAEGRVSSIIFWR